MKTAIGLIMMVAAAPTAAQAPGKACSGVAPILAPELAGWVRRVTVDAALASTGLQSARIAPGQAIDAKLSTGSKVHFGDGEARAAEVGDNAGIFAFSVDRPGTYRVALGSAGWVDVLEGGKAIESSAHGHGAECSGIVKLVDFPLKAGEHVLQIEGSKEAVVGLMVVRVP